MSGGSNHNPNGRQPQLGPTWSHLGLQVGAYYGRTPQAAHMSSERVTWHTPTPPTSHHIYPPPDTLQSLKVPTAPGNPLYRHTPTPPELYRHTPTPPDKLYRHTPPPSDVKSGYNAAEIFALHQSRAAVVLQEAIRDKSRTEELLPYTHSGSGVDLTLGRPTNGAPISLSVRDAPTINSLLSRARPHRVDALLERIQHSPQHSVIVRTPDHDASDDSVDSSGAPKRKRKPERTTRVPVPIPQVENGEYSSRSPAAEEDISRARRKTSSGSETIDDIAAAIAATNNKLDETPIDNITTNNITVDELKTVLGSPTPGNDTVTDEPAKVVQHRRSARNSVSKTPTDSPTKQNSLNTNTVIITKIDSECVNTSVTDNVNCDNITLNEVKQKEPSVITERKLETVNKEKPSQDKPHENPNFVEIEHQLEQMFAGIEERTGEGNKEKFQMNKSELEQVDSRKRKKKVNGGVPKKKCLNNSKANQHCRTTEAYDSGSNASSCKSRGPYVQVRGPRDSPTVVTVVNTNNMEDEDGLVRRRNASTDIDFRGKLSSRGLHRSTLGTNYDATTPDLSWVCAFCGRGPHANSLGDLFGPYSATTDCDEYRALNPSAPSTGSVDVWLHEECGVWTGGLVATGARVTGLEEAVWGARAESCSACRQQGASVWCAKRSCGQRVHVPCARDNSWLLREDIMRAYCKQHISDAH